MRFVFTVNASDVSQAYDFAEKLVGTSGASENISVLDHGNLAKTREITDSIADHARGKVAEFGFKQFFKHNFDIITRVDLEVWAGKTNTDDGNDLAEISFDGKSYRLNHKVDIKGIKSNAEWLLVESHKFWADVYVVVKILNIPVGREFEANPFPYRDKNWKTEICGWVKRTDIVYRENEPWFLYPHGSELYKTHNLPRIGHDRRPKEYQEKLREMRLDKLKVRLMAPMNYGYPVIWLHNTDESWRNFARRVKDEAKLGGSS